MLQFSTDEDSLVLDFFAGSCTTAQAALELNLEDGGNRQFIMVQLPEPTPENSVGRKAEYKTISDIGKQRILRVLDRIQSDNDLFASRDLGVRIFKLTQSNYCLWNGVAENTSEFYAEQMRVFSDTPLVEGWNLENVIYEVDLKEGYRINSFIEFVKDMEQNTIYRVSSVNKEQVFFICLDEELFQDDVDKLALTNEVLFIYFDNALDDTKAANLSRQYRLKTI